MMRCKIASPRRLVDVHPARFAYLLPRPLLPRAHHSQYSGFPSASISNHIGNPARFSYRHERGASLVPEHESFTSGTDNLPYDCPCRETMRAQPRNLVPSMTEPVLYRNYVVAGKPLLIPPILSQCDDIGTVAHTTLDLFRCGRSVVSRNGKCYVGGYEDHRQEQADRVLVEAPHDRSLFEALV